MLKLPDEEKSLWREAYKGSLYPELGEDLEVDVVVVGAGITGLTAAYLLTQSGFKVAVIEKDTVSGGTTGRTTGKVTSQHSLIYNELLSILGQKGAKLYADAAAAAVDQVDKIITGEAIDCDWQRADNYVYTAQASNIKKFKDEAEAAARLGLPATFETNLPLPFEVVGAVKFSGQGRFSSQRYLLGLAEVIKEKGGHIYEHSNVISIRDGNPGRIRTSKASVAAKHIIVATNVPTLPLIARGGYCLLEYPTESYIVAAPYDKDLKGMYISPDSQHYSILPALFEGKHYLLVGGGGHLSGLRFSKKAHFTRLAKYAEANFGIDSFTHKWSDRDYMGYDKIPLIGKLYPWSKNLYVATGFRKWGLSSGTMAAMILSDTIAGKPHPAASIFTPQRLRPIKSIPKAVLEQTKELINP